VHWETLRGQQALHFRGELSERLTGLNASIHAWRQAVDLVAAEQDDRNAWANRP
jgi:hypothetical protein